MKKERHLKTIYERFSHHKINNLKDFEQDIDEKIHQYFSNKKITHRNVFKALLDLNITYSGKFYFSANNENKHRYSDAQFFRQYAERIEVDNYLKNKEYKYLEVHVLASDFDGNSLVIYRDNNSWSTNYNIQIINERKSDILLNGNIAILLDNPDVE